LLHLIESTDPRERGDQLLHFSHLRFRLNFKVLLLLLPFIVVNRAVFTCEPRSDTVMSE
jgi:hypothetical protein